MICYTLNDIEDVLVQENSLVVHFSGCPKGVGYKITYPLDLKKVISNEAQSGISCSTIKPGDSFSGMDRNATGCIGTILRLKNAASLLVASPVDRGTSSATDGNQIILPPPQSISEIKESITNRNPQKYNEWRVSNYTVIGIFAIYPFEISTIETIETMPGIQEQVNSINSTNIPEILAEFPDSDIYSFCMGKLVRLMKNSMFWKEISIASIYGRCG